MNLIKLIILFFFAKKCKKHRILLSQKKAEITKPRIEFLGLILDETEIKIQPHI